MRLKKTHCSNCGSMLDLQVDENHSQVFCPYCGQVYEINHRRKEIVINQNIQVTERYTDEADVIRAKTEDHKSRTKWKIVIAIIIVWFSAAFVVNVLPDIQNQGKICAGDYWDHTGLNYKAVEQYFRELGFQNIVLIDLMDADSTKKEDVVESISINGVSSFFDNDYFWPSDKVIIRYH